MTVPVLAASVLLVRGSDRQEIFIVQRAKSLRFFGGFLAFPGGKVNAVDADVSVVLDEREASSTDVTRDRYVAAARELFEETGVLLARAADGSFPSAIGDLDQWRRKLMAEPQSFGQLLSEAGLSIWAADFTPVGNLVTPPFAPLRFDTTFFLAALPPGQQATIWPGELEEGYWATPESVLDSWQRGERLVSPPSLLILQCMQEHLPPTAPLELTKLFELHNGDGIPPVYLAPEVQVIPLRTWALPPSIHTNAYLVGRDPAYLIDPGPSDVDEQQRMFAVLDRRFAAGVRLRAVVLSHHHPDHVGGAAACAARYGAPVWAHPWTAHALEKKLPVAAKIMPGDKLDLGLAPDRSGPWQLDAIGTPGHAPGHLAFYEEHYRLLFAGDMVSTQSSIVIAPPEGNLAVYMDSLRLLKEYPCRLLLPGHGSASSRPLETLDESIAHRLKREEMLTAALGQEARTVTDLTLELYKGVPPHLMRFAEMQVLAGLQKLALESKAHEVGNGDAKGWRRPSVCR